MERNEWTKLAGFSSPVLQVAYNSRHTLFLTAERAVYSCGNNQRGQLVRFLVASNLLGNWKYNKSEHVTKNYAR